MLQSPLQVHPYPLPCPLHEPGPVVHDHVVELAVPQLCIDFASSMPHCENVSSR